MGEMPKESLNRQKDYVIARSPMLRFFFDPLIESDKEAWLEVVEKYYLSKKKNLEEARGKEALDLGFVIAAGDNPEAFPFGATGEQKRGLFGALALVGYEIGDREKTMLMMDDIYSRLAIYGLVTYRKASVLFVFYALCVGNSLNTGVKEEKIPEVFADFIKNRLGLNP